MKAVFPAAVRAHLDAQTYDPERLACLELVGAKRGWSGMPESLGIARDSSWVDDLFLGWDDAEPVFMPLIQSPTGVALQVHRFRTEGRIYVLFVSVSKVISDLGERQQQGHRLALQQREQAQALKALTQGRQTWVDAGAEDAQSVITTFAHEFGTPLTALLGQLEVLAGQTHEPRQRERVSAIRRSASHLHALVQGLLDEARLGHGTLELSPVELEVAELAADLSAMFEPEARRLGLSWQLSCDPARIQVDAVRLRQVLINLLSNAMKYGRGAVQAELRTTPFELRAEVSDEGAGFTQVQRESLFQPFRRFATGHGDGSGLGLFIARQLALALGGSLSLISGDGEGAHFQLRVPIKVASVQTMPDRMRELLVVDDDPDVRVMLSALLAPYYFSVDEAVDLESVVQRLALRPDVMLVDLGLGTESGLDVITHVRRNGYRGRIVATSADHSTVHTRAAKSAGADAFIAKPFDTTRLVRILHAD